MNIDQISPSILHVTASQNLDVSEDLKQEGSKTIAELLNEEKKEDDQSED